VTRSLFVTATGTGCGKTWVSRGLLRALRRRELRVAGLKPLETGVDREPLDALALARAADRPGLANLPGLVRARSPVSPLAATLSGELPPIDLSALVATLRHAASDSDVALAEGAGGLLVPLTPEATTAELAAELGWPLVLIARDALGTLSHTLSALESAARRDLPVAAVVLTRGPWSERDPSVDTNAEILRARTHAPVCVFPSTRDDDDALADAAEPLLPVLFGALLRSLLGS
jgi:dethiobiotin synthetase